MLVCHWYVLFFFGWQNAVLTALDTPYETVEEAQTWWKSVDIPEQQKQAIARGNAIRLFKLPLEP
jgi:2,3-dihydroxybenzoate decarboxylase